MNRILQISKKTVLTLAILLMTTATAWADQTITIGDGQTSTQNVTATGGEVVYINVPGGVGTYNGTISGSCIIKKIGAGKAIIISENYYAVGSAIYVDAGILQLNGNVTGPFYCMKSVVIAAGAILRFEPKALMRFSLEISGAGKVEYKGTSDKELILDGNNTYTGTTTIEAGELTIGDHGYTGSIAGDIIVKSGTLGFWRYGDYTYSKTISGSGGIAIYSGCNLILTGTNTYEGKTEIRHKLQVGDGTKGSIDNTSGVEITFSDGILRFEPGAPLTFSKVISGEGKVEYKGAPSDYMYLTGNNTYTGTTTIVSGSRLCIGSNGTTGTVAGDIINNGILYFRRSDDYTFSGKISGTGTVIKYCKNTLTFKGENKYSGATTINEGTLQIGGSAGSISGDITNNSTLEFYRSNAYTYSGVISGTGDVKISSSAILGSSVTLGGVNTYTGATYIDGRLVLGAGGSIEKSSGVTFTGSFGRLDISAGNKKIKALTSGFSLQLFYNGTVELGTRTLTIGTAGQDDGGGSFRGVFSGTGNVTKTGTESFSMRGVSTATGTFNHSQGTVTLYGTWAGDYNKAANTTLTITGNPTIGGKLTLAGGTINMNVTAFTPSKITVNDRVIASGTNTLNITAANDVTNYVLIQAASGIPDTGPYTVNPSTFDDWQLSANGTQLVLTAKVGIEELETTNLRVYPNPTTGVLKITNYELGIKNVEVFDIYGRTQNAESRMGDEEIVLNISHLATGVYFLRIETENKMITQKIIKN